MTAPTKAQRERAREIVANLKDIEAPEWVVMCMRSAALAAIIETQEVDARIAERKFADAGWHGDYFNAGIGIAAAIRDGSYRDGV